MTFEIRVTTSARQDLREIHAFISTQESSQRAVLVGTRLKKAVASLSASPHRGHAIPELRGKGAADYREIHSRPYRIIFRIIHETVHVIAILDGRRDLQDMLFERMMRM